MFKSLLLKGRTLCLLLCCMISSLVVTAQTKHTGKVIGGDDKQPVVGASVKIKGTNTGAVTDVNGEFNLTLSPGNVLVVSYLTYQTKEVTVSGDQYLNITLQPATTSLNEVVVTGYQTQVKKDITGAIGIVDVADAKRIQTSSSEQMLQGQVSGVTVVNNGAPGAPSQVFVRGITNFGNTTPLYVVDGVQVGDMSNINPNDVESINVLKDAGSAAIYGIAGSNGVIVITTKKGKAGKTVLNYDAYYATQRPLSGNVWHLMTPAQQSQLTFDAGDTGEEVLYPGGPGTLPVYGYHGGVKVPVFQDAGVTNDPAIEKYYNFDPANPANDYLVQKFNAAGTDWFHEIFKPAPMQSHTITASGGTDKSTFLYSLQYFNQTGTLLNTFEKRYQLRVNNTYSVLNNHLRVGESGYVYYKDNNGGYSGSQQQEGGSIAETYRTLPIIPVHDIAGNYGGGYDGPGGEPLGNSANPVAIQERQINDRSHQWNMQGTVFAEADFLKHFTARTAFGGNSNNFYYFNTGYNQYENYEPHAGANAFTEVSGFSFTYNFTNSLTYKQTFGKHSVSAFAAYEIKNNGGRQVGTSATNFVTLDPNFLTVNATTLPSSITLGNTYLYQHFGTESYFGRVDYSYDDKYLLGATLRRDGYSAFAPGRQWGTFPSVSLGWRLSQEEFLKGISWLNELKLRGSYGTVGSNGNIRGVNALNTYNYGFGSTFYGIGGGLNTTTTGYAQTGIGNPFTTWETDKILNVGLDVSLFNHFDLSLEYYKKSISGLLFPVTLPATVGGASSPTVNVGDVQNKGLDASLSYHGSIHDVRINAVANITTYKNRITAIPINGGYFDVSSGTRIGGFVREQVGQPIGEFFGYQVQGIYQNPQQLSSLPGYSGAVVGSYIYKDVNGDGKVDANDRTFIGNPNPDFTYGLNLNVSWKGFDVATVFYGSYGNKDFNYVKYWTDTYHSFPGGKDLDLLTKSARVDPTTNTVTNPGATQQALTVSNTIPSTFYVESGSFLKLRSAQIGYNFDAGMLKSLGVSKLRVYIQGTNLFTITKYTGLDPELVPSLNNLNQGGANPQQSASFGVDYGAYPANQKTYSLGVNLTF